MNLICFSPKKLASTLPRAVIPFSSPSFTTNFADFAAWTRFRRVDQNRKSLHWRSFWKSRGGSHSPSAALVPLTSPPCECSVIVDLHKHGHRQAFNSAFHELGLDCANWTPPLYTDLWRSSGGNEEALVRLFFETTGWPSTLPTADYPLFVTKVVQAKRRALDAAALRGDLPLKPGLQDFLREAQAAGSPVAVLTAYAKCGENVGRALVNRLRGALPEGEIVLVDESVVDGSLYAQVALGLGSTGSLDERLAVAVAEQVAAERQRVAEEVAAELKVSVELEATSSTQGKRQVAALRAAAELVHLPSRQCVLVGGTHGGLQSALRIGMPCVMMRSSATAQAAFPQARATVEGFGAGTLTFDRLIKMMQNGTQSGSGG